MREVAILTFLTLDGVMQGPSSPEEDPSDGFIQGGWAKPYWDEVMQQATAEAMVVPYDLLLGRKTYDIFAASFLSSDEDNPVAKRMNNAKKFVVTKSISSELSWQNSSPVTGDIVAEILRLKGEDGPLLQVHGSQKLIQTLLAHDLIDEFRLWTFPVVLGGGKRLFSAGVVSCNLSLIKTDSTSNGVLMAFYRRQ